MTQSHLILKFRSLWTLIKPHCTYAFMALGMCGWTSAVAQTSEFTTTENGQTITYSKTENVTTKTAIDDTGRSLNRVWIYETDEKSRPLFIDGPRNDVTDNTIIERQNDGALVTVTNALGHKSHFYYNEDSSPLRYINANAVETKFEYANDRLSVVTVAAGTDVSRAYQLNYNSAGQVSQLVLPNGMEINDTIGADGAYSTAASPTIIAIQKILNADDLSHLYGENLPTRRLGLPLALNDADNAQSSYDDDGRLIRHQNLDGGKIDYGYDQNENLSQVVDANGVITRFTHNGFGEVTAEHSSERGTTRYVYDSAGNIIKEVRQDGLVIKREFDELNRMSKEVFKKNGVDRKVNRYVYDNCENGIGRVCKVISDGNITRFSYDALGSYTKVATKLEGAEEFGVSHYNYGKAGQLESIQYPTDLVVKYVYSEDGFVTKVIGQYLSGADKERFVIAKNIRFNPNSENLIGLTYGNGLKTSFTFGEDELISKIVTKKDGQEIERSIFARDNNGNVTAISKLNPEEGQSFSYDAMNRLVSEQRGDSADSEELINYTYDAVGNRTAREEGSQQPELYTYMTGSNQLKQINGKTLDYDARGNLIADRNGKRQFSYDVTNRLTAFSKNDEVHATYTYNAYGQRIRKTVQRSSGSEGRYTNLEFAYTPQGQLLAEYGSNNQNAKLFTREYIWLGNQPLAQLSRVVDQDGNTRRASVSYLHTDNIGTPRTATNDNADVVWKWDGDAFGKGKADRDVDGDGKNTVIRLRFPGQYYDRESGLHYNQQRDFDPTLGRYIQSDPIGLWGGINRYAYVGGNPLNSIDPSGLASCTGTRIKHDVCPNTLAVVSIATTCDVFDTYSDGNWTGSFTRCNSSFVTAGVGPIMGGAGSGSGSYVPPTAPQDGDVNVGGTTNCLAFGSLGTGQTCRTVPGVTGETFNSELEAVKAVACAMNRLSSTTGGIQAGRAPEYGATITAAAGGFRVSVIVSDGSLNNVNHSHLLSNSVGSVATVHSHGNSNVDADNQVSRGDFAAANGYARVYGTPRGYTVTPAGYIHVITGNPASGVTSINVNQLQQHVARTPCVSNPASG